MPSRCRHFHPCCARSPAGEAKRMIKKGEESGQRRGRGEEDPTRGGVEFRAIIPALSRQGAIPCRLAAGARGKARFDEREARETSRGHVIYRFHIAGSIARCVGRTLAATISVAVGERPGQQGFRGPCAITNASIDRASASGAARVKSRGCEPNHDRLSRRRVQILASEIRASSRALDGMLPAPQSRLPLVGHGRLSRRKSLDKKPPKNGTEAWHYP